MAVVVREIMNEELYAIGLHDTVGETVSAIVALQITAAPVLDENRRPRGMVTLRDLLDAPPTRAAAECATPEFAVIQVSDSLTTAARIMAESGHHQLVVVDGERRAIGIVSAFDVMRALVGAPVTRPRAFPHFDSGAEVSWSDDATLEARNIVRAPSSPGVVALVLGGAARSERVMWAEVCEDVRARLEELRRGPNPRDPRAGALARDRTTPLPRGGRPRSEGARARPRGRARARDGRAPLGDRRTGLTAARLTARAPPRRRSVPRAGRRARGWLRAADSGGSWCERPPSEPARGNRGRLGG